jgi:putative transcriptional regulator
MPASAGEVKESVYRGECLLPRGRVRTKIYVALPYGEESPTANDCNRKGGSRPRTKEGRILLYAKRKTLMPTPRKTKVPETKDRTVFQAMMQAVEEMRLHREGKITLRTHKIEPAVLPVVDAQLIRDTREQLKVSRRIFARQLQINERTLEKWEQGRTKPNKQAAALILLTRKFPDTLKRLAQVAA